MSSGSSGHNVTVPELLYSILFLISRMAGVLVYRLEMEGHRVSHSTRRMEQCGQSKYGLVPSYR